MLDPYGTLTSGLDVIVVKRSERWDEGIVGYMRGRIFGAEEERRRGRHVRWRIHVFLDADYWVYNERHGYHGYIFDYELMTDWQIECRDPSHLL